SHPVIYTLSLHDALPIYGQLLRCPHFGPFLDVARDHVDLENALLANGRAGAEQLDLLVTDLAVNARRKTACILAERGGSQHSHRSEEHTSELQSRFDLVC